MFINPFKNRKTVHLIFEVLIGLFAVSYLLFSGYLPYFFLIFSFVFLNRFIEKPQIKSYLLIFIIFLISFIYGAYF